MRSPYILKNQGVVVGHVVGKDIYRKLGKKIDGLTMRAPWNETLHGILTELYSPEEAEIIVNMPYGLSDFDRIVECTGRERAELQLALDSLCEKGLVMDLVINGGSFYSPSPMVIGIFEFTMMRTRGDLKYKEWAGLFHEYLHGDSSFWAANFDGNNKVSIMRTLPHEGTIHESVYMEVLDYEKATSIVEAADKFAIGICSCRHEKQHVGEKECEVPLETCSSFGFAADYLVRHGMAEEVSKSQMLENIARSKELGLVLNADNVQNDITFICHCCKCCCNVLMGINRHGYENVVITSNYISSIDIEKCSGCEKCARACPIDAIEMVPIENPKTKKKKDPRIDTSICLGCGVCALKCHKDAVFLLKRDQRVIQPETVFEKVILQCLERGTLQNQMFSDPGSLSHKFLRGFLGGFLRLSPVKKALMSDTLRSSFLSVIQGGAGK
jgi:Pyruvate/2-oxoacid:ferredoxin oxidoreductase delta subunit